MGALPSRDRPEDSIRLGVVDAARVVIDSPVGSDPRLTRVIASLAKPSDPLKAKIELRGDAA